MKFAKLTDARLTTTDGEYHNLPLNETYIIGDSDMPYNILAYRCGSEWACLAIDLSNMYDKRIIVESLQRFTYVFDYKDMSYVYGHKYDRLCKSFSKMKPYGFEGINRVMFAIKKGIIDMM